MKRWKVVFVLVLTLAYAGWLGYMVYQHRTVSTEARLNVERIENGVVYGTAAFAVKGLYNNETVQNLVSVQVTILPTTTITKTAYYLPSLDELKKNDWRYNTADLRTEVVSGSYDDLTDFRKHISGITVYSEGNIWKKKTFTAVRITYEEQVWPF